MSRPDAQTTAGAVMPGITVRAAGLFGVQDRALAVGLLGEARVATIVEPLTATPTAPIKPDSRSGRAVAEIEAMRPWVAVPVLVAISEHALHICDWDSTAGATREVARIPLEQTATQVEQHGSARRLTLVDRRTGYRLPLTSTVSRMSPDGAGVREVLAALPTSEPTDHPPLPG